MFALPDAWVWDFWLVDDGRKYHMFFLYASKALRDPQARHLRASIGHAVSDDLVEWTRVVDALVRSDPPAFDDVATWTGSVVQHPDGTWFLFYTGVTRVDGEHIQSIGYATSSDLMVWDRQGRILSADSRWYERIDAGLWHNEAFRDPWVYPDGDGWRMLITARANHGAADDRGVVATAVSPDLRSWQLEAPLTEPGEGFAQLEVLETVRIDGEPFVIFNCLAGELSAAHQATGATGGVWIMPAEDSPSPWRPSRAVQLTGPDRFVGRIIRNRAGETVFLAFSNIGAEGRFVGTITDPTTIGLVDGVPRLLEGEPI